MTDAAVRIDQAIALSGQMIDAGQPLRATELLHPHLGAAPKDYWLNVQLGRAYAQLGDRNAATERFLTAVTSGDPEPAAALYELVRLDLSAGDFSRIELLDEALALPGELECRWPATNQKWTHYCRLLFLKALVALERGDHDGAEQHLRAAYGVTGNHYERSFAFDWVLARLRSTPPLPTHPHVEYIRHQFLRLNMMDSLDYGALLDDIDYPAHVLEIGAMDGVRFDQLHPHLVEKKWSAVVVEPLPDMFERLRRTYAGCGWVRCANVALSDVAGPLVMYRMDPEVADRPESDWLLGISSALKNADLRYFEGAVKEEVVRAITFDQLVEEFDIRKIDILQIDVEGYDWKVFEQVDLDKWKIGLLRIELVHVKPPDRLKVFEKVHKAGYAFTFDGMDLTGLKAP